MLFGKYKFQKKVDFSNKIFRKIAHCAAHNSKDLEAENLIKFFKNSSY